MDPLEPSAWFRIVDVMGVVANGLLGGAVARRMGFDIVGFAILAVLSGLGGGLLRDVLLDVRPVALTDPAYITGSLVAALIAYLLNLRGRWTGRVLVLADLLALGCWSATGTSKALVFGIAVLPAVLLGVLTAVGGGMLRDVFVGRVPAIFGGNPLYATVAVVGSLEMALFWHLRREEVGMLVAILTCTALAGLARRRGWVLPGAADLEARLRQVRMPQLRLPLRTARRRRRAERLHSEPGSDASA